MLNDTSYSVKVLVISYFSGGKLMNIVEPLLSGCFIIRITLNI